MKSVLFSHSRHWRAHGGGTVTENGAIKTILVLFRLSFFREKIYKAVHSSSWIRSTAEKARLGRTEMKGDRDVTEQNTVEKLPIESSLRVQEKRSSVAWLQIPLETMNWQRWQGRRWKKLDSRSSRPGNSCGIWDSVNTSYHRTLQCHMTIANPK